MAVGETPLYRLKENSHPSMNPSEMLLDLVMEGESEEVLSCIHCSSEPSSEYGATKTDEALALSARQSTNPASRESPTGLSRIQPDSRTTRGIHPKHWLGG